MEEHCQEQAKRRQHIELEVIPAHETLVPATSSPTEAEMGVVEVPEAPPTSVVEATRGRVSPSFGDDIAQVPGSTTSTLPLAFGEEEVKLLPDMSNQPEAPAAKRSKTDTAHESMADPNKSSTLPVEARTPSSILESQFAPDSENLNDTVPRLVIRQLVTEDNDILDDGYRWRKYGQKNIKENPNYPRSYYRCTADGCKVKKYVERSIESVQGFYETITTYEGIHNHPPPHKKQLSTSKLSYGASFRYQSGSDQGTMQLNPNKRVSGASGASGASRRNADAPINFAIQGIGTISSNVPAIAKAVNQPLDKSGLASHMLESLSHYGGRESVSEDSRDLSDKLLQRVVQQQHHITLPGTPVNELGAEQSLPHSEAFLEAFKERADPYEQYANRTVGDTQGHQHAPSARHTSSSPAYSGLQPGITHLPPVGNASAVLSDVLQASRDAMPSGAHRHTQLGFAQGQGGITIPAATLETLLRKAAASVDPKNGAAYHAPSPSSTQNPSIATSQALLSLLFPDYYQSQQQQPHRQSPPQRLQQQQQRLQPSTVPGQLRDQIEQHGQASVPISSSHQTHHAEHSILSSQALEPNVLNE